jgi:hypothetical protein
MPTPASDEFIEFVDGSSTLHCGTRAIRCRDWSGLFSVGPSRGQNRPIPGVAGRRKRTHVRDELSVTLQFQVNGAFDDDGVPQPSGLRARCLGYVDDVRTFLDDADGRQLEVRLTTVDGTSTGDVTFEDMSRIRFPASWIAEFEVLVTLPDGLLALPEAS